MESETRLKYRFGDVEIDLARGVLIRNGEETRLRHKTFAVLAYLIEHRDTDLSKDDIISAVWHNTAVVDDVLVQSIKDIRRALGEDTRQPRFIRTIPKFGYRFIGAAEDFVTDTALNDTAIPVPTNVVAARPWPKFAISGAIIAALLIAAAFAIPRIWSSNSDIRVAQSPGKRSVMVMFFENQTKDEDLNWLREGLADMLIAGLSRSQNLTVLSRVQLHVLLDRGTPGGTAITLPQTLDIAKRSGSQTLVAGSFSRLGEKVRIDTQAYDVSSGDLLASESLTVDRADQILTQIDLISLKLGNKLGGTGVEPTNGVARAMTTNLEAYRCYSVAVEKAHALHSHEAITLLERAIALDPEFAMAHARIGYTYAVAQGLAEKGKAPLERAFRLADRLTELDRLNINAWYAIANLDYTSAIRSLQEIIAKYPLETEAYWRSGRLLLGEERYEEAINVLKQGLLVDPDGQDIYNALSVTYRDSNRHDEAVAMAQRYQLLAPNEPNALDTLALAYQAKGDYEKAEASYRRALEIQPNFEIAVLHLANLNFQIGKYGEAIKLYESYVDLAKSDSDKAWAFGRISWVHWRKGDARAAAVASEKEQKLDPQSYVFPLLLAIERKDAQRVGALRQRVDEQIAYSERGLRPSPRLLHFLRGKLAQFDGNIDQAIASYSQAIKHRPMVWDIDSYEDCLALGLFQAGRNAEAAAEYQRIIAVNPKYPLASLNLARIARKNGDARLAKEEYGRFLENWKPADAAIPELSEATAFLSNAE